MTDYLTTAEVAQRYRTADSTVRYWRMIDYGPLGTKCGRKVLYPVADAELTALAAEKSADGAA